MEHTAIRLLAASTLIGFLSACGGGGSGTPDQDPDPSPQADDPAIDEIVQTLDEVDTLTETPNEAVPTTGSVDYSGSLLLGTTSDVEEIKANPDYFADANFAVDFEASSVSGGFTSFVSSSGSDVEGALTISDSVVEDGNVVGDLSGSVESSTYEGLLVSLFLGENSETLAGSVAIEDTADETDQLFGSFAVDAQE